MSGKPVSTDEDDRLMNIIMRDIEIDDIALATSALRVFMQERLKMQRATKDMVAAYDRRSDGTHARVFYVRENKGSITVRRI
jgi:hypothetical protein